MVTDANITRQVIEYLSKKGYTKTEATLRAESANQDVEGRPINSRTEDFGGVKYRQGFGEACHINKGIKLSLIAGIDLLRRWIEDNLDIYKVTTTSHCELDRK